MPQKSRSILNLILASTLLLVAISACGNQSEPATETPVPTPGSPTIFGHWRGMDDGNEVIIFFEANGNVALTYLGSLHGGTFTLDEKATPMQLDLTFEDTGLIQTILEFVDENTLRFENNFTNVERPTAFSDFITLTRDQ